MSRNTTGRKYKRKHVPETLRTVDDIRKGIAEKGLDPRMLVVPPPLAVDSDLGENVRIKVEDLTYDSLTKQEIKREGESKETGLLRSFFEHHGSFIPDIIQAYDDFIRNFTVAKQIRIRGTNYRAVFANVKFSRPAIVMDGKVIPLYPQIARSVHSYMTHIFGDLQMYEINEGRWDAVDKPVPNVQIGSIPVMVRSILCRLYGLTRDELLGVGEDPNDPGGYFIVKGNEKTIPMNDMLRENRIHLMNNGDEMGLECRTTTRANPTRRSITTQLYEYEGMIRVIFSDYPSFAGSGMLRSLSKKDKMSRMLNALQIFRIFGKQESPQELVDKYVMRFVRAQWKGLVLSRLASTIFNLPIQGDYIGFVIKRFQDMPDFSRIIPGDGIDESKRIFDKNVRDCFLSQMATDSDEARLLCYGMMIARFTEYLCGLRSGDDRNDYGNKRLVSAAERIERNLLKSINKMFSTVEQDIDGASQSLKLDIKYIASRINGKFVTDSFESCFTTTLWGTLKDPSPEENVTEPLYRVSHVAVLSHLTKIVAKTSSNNKDLEIRSVQPSQFNYVCPSDTPERKRVGIVKHRAIGCITSMQRSGVFLDIITARYVSKSLHEPGCSLMINGRYIGTVDGVELQKTLLNMRREGTLDYDTMIVFEKTDNILHVHNDSSRPIAPLLIVNTETERLVIEEKNLWGQPFAELLRNGAVEYIDAYEQKEIKLATNYWMLDLAGKIRGELIERHNALLEIKEQIIAGNPPDNSDDISRTEAQISKMKEDLVIKQAIFEGFSKEKKELIELDIEPDDAVALQNRTDEVRRVKASENEAAVDYNRAKNELGRKEQYVSTLRSAFTLVVINDELESLENKLSKESSRLRYTHCMLSPDSLFSFAASIIPAAGMQLATRVSYHCSKGKQALGFYSGTFPIRMDVASKVLSWPSRPIFTSHISDIIGMGDLPQGETALVAVNPFGGYNQEDALIMSQGAADRGLFSHSLFHLQVATLNKGENFVESFGAPPSRCGRDAYIFAGVGDDGLPKIGHYLKDGQAYCCKIKKVTGDPKPQFVVEKVGLTHEGMVERIILGVNHEGNTFARIKLRQTSKAVVGTKLVMRVAMKGTISKILPNDEMPYFFAPDGTKIVPDVIINPHGVTARMSIGLLAELFMSRVGAMTATTVDASSFKKLDLDGTMQFLKAHGMDPYGREIFYNPITHKPMECPIFAGFAYTSVLPAIPSLKIQARNKGARRLLTRQPTRGADASESTGMRIGTQERDALISHGASEILRERLCTSSDEHTDIFCRNCGKVAQSNINTGDVSCPHCGDKATFGRVCMPHPFKTFRQLLDGAGFSLSLGFDPEEKKGNLAPEESDDDDEDEEDENSQEEVLMDDDQSSVVPQTPIEDEYEDSD